MSNDSHAKANEQQKKNAEKMIADAKRQKEAAKAKEKETKK